MSTFLSADILAGLVAGPVQRRRGPRLTVRAAGLSWPVLRRSARGFVMAEGAPLLPGRVDLYEGERHVMQGLAVRGEDAEGEVSYEFKWCAEPRTSAPLDFAPEADAPVALLA